MAEACPFEITPLDVAKNFKSIPVQNLNYTNQDYWSLKTRALEIIKTNFSSEFNDFTESSIAIMLVEVYAFIADLLSFKIDQQGNEIFVDTVTELENMFRLTKLVGFKPTPPLPAKAMFVASINNPLSSDIYIKTPTALTLNEFDGFNQYFELFAADVNNNPAFNQAIVIPAGKTSTGSIVGIQGKSKSAQFGSNGASDQIFRLSQRSVLYGSVNLSINGVLWQEVEHFTDSKPKMEYRTELSPDYDVFIIFGNNQSGLIPPKGADIRVGYRVGGGTSGNIITGAFEQEIHVRVPNVNIPITVRVKNYTKGEFGYSGDTIEDIRRKLPTYLRTQHRAVTGTDYKNLSAQFKTIYNGLIAKATAVLRNHGCAGNVIDLYVLSKDSDDDLIKANDNLKMELLAELNKKKMFTDYVCVKDGNIIPVDVHVDVFLDKYHRKFEESVKERVTRRMNAFFSTNNWEYGQTLRETDIVKALSDVKEVSHFDITFTTAQSLESGVDNNIVSTRYNEIINLDNFSMSFNYKEDGEA